MNRELENSEVSKQIKRELKEYLALNIPIYINDYNNFLITLNAKRINKLIIMDDKRLKLMAYVYYEKTIDEFKRNKKQLPESLKNGFDRFFSEKKRVNDRFKKRYDELTNKELIKKLVMVSRYER